MPTLFKIFRPGRLKSLVAGEKIRSPGKFGVLERICDHEKKFKKQKVSVSIAQF
jgi:hypothetical protein